MGYGGAFASLSGSGDLEPSTDDTNGLFGGSAPDASGPVAHGADAKVPSAQPGTVTSTGALDKAVIRRRIRQNLGKIRYCYEKELLGNPRLVGTVTAVFTIGASGRVTRSSALGVDPRVAACVADVIATIEFPRPRGGGTVDVTYPIAFRPDGG